MSTRKVFLSSARTAVAALALALVLPTGARAQFSAIATGNILENAPVFTPSALVLDQGGVSVGAAGAYFIFDTEELFGPGNDGDASAALLQGGLAYGLTDMITVGAAVPWITSSAEFDGFENDVSGLGDIVLFGTAQLWRSGDDRTKLAAIADVELPTANDDFFLGEDSDLEVERDPSFSIGGAVSHAADRASLHGSVAYAKTGDIEIEGIQGEGGSSVDLSGAAVFTASDAVRISAEALVEVPDEGDTAATLGGALRYTASPNLFVDAGVLFPVTESVIDAAIVVGFTWVR